MPRGLKISSRRMVSHFFPVTASIMPPTAAYMTLLYWARVRNGALGSRYFSRFRYSTREMELSGQAPSWPPTPVRWQSISRMVTIADASLSQRAKPRM